MITHIVFLNIKPELNKAEILATLKSNLLGLNDSISELNHLEFGVDFNQSDVAYDATLYSNFNTKADLEAYQIHPEHLKVKDYIGKVCSSRAVVDYEN
ncbi:MAG: Dabb family protein [Cyclobacteriaceae bacterium]|nr:Dabb family protein [Cyclobacteriaceae bacterium]